MNNKIKTYIEVLFSDVPQSIKASELKKELLFNMSESYEDYIGQGKSENEAYSLVVSNMGDIDEMLLALMPSDEFKKQANYFRKRNAKNIAISIAMYIIGVAFLIGLGGFGSLSGDQDRYGITGLLVLLVISAIATGIIIYTNMSTPPEYKHYNGDNKEEFKNLDSKHSKLLSNILSIYWLIITFIYLSISFITGLWAISWIIWILAVVFHLILKTIFEMKYSNEENND